MFLQVSIPYYNAITLLILKENCMVRFQNIYYTYGKQFDFYQNKKLKDTLQ